MQGKYMKGLYPRYDVPMTFTWKKSLSALLAGLLVSASVTVAVSALESHGTGAKIQRAGLTNNPNYTFSDAYKTGGYESATSPFGPSVADDLIAGQLKLMGELYK